MNSDLLDAIRAKTRNKQKVSTAGLVATTPTPTPSVPETEQQQIDNLMMQMDQCGQGTTSELFSATCRQRYILELAELKTVFRENTLFRQHNVMDIPGRVLGHFETECSAFSSPDMRYMGRWEAGTTVPSNGELGMFYIIQGSLGECLVWTSDNTWQRVLEKDLQRTPWGKQIDHLLVSLVRVRTMLRLLIEKGITDPTLVYSDIIEALGTRGCMESTNKRKEILSRVDGLATQKEQKRLHEMEVVALETAVHDPIKFFDQFKTVLLYAKNMRELKLRNNHIESEATRIGFTRFQESVLTQIQRMYPNLNADLVEETFTKHILDAHRETLQKAFPGFDNITVVMTLEDARIEIARLSALVEKAVPSAPTTPPLPVSGDCVELATQHTRLQEAHAFIQTAYDKLITKEDKTPPPHNDKKEKATVPDAKKETKSPPLPPSSDDTQLQQAYDVLSDQYESLQLTHTRLQSKYESERLYKEPVPTTTFSTKLHTLGALCLHENQALDDLASRFYNQLITFKHHWVTNHNVYTSDQSIEYDTLRERVLVVRPMIRKRLTTTPLTENMKRRIRTYFKTVSPLYSIP
jgi:hypothetical protein